MNDWQNDWWEQLEKTTATVENFFSEIDRAVESIAEEVTDALEEINEQFQDTVVTEVDRFVDYWLDFISETEREINRTFWEDIDNLVNDLDFVEMSTEMATEENHPTCIGCSNYHGQSYNGQLLVCAMHPYGVETDSCPDWEA